MAEINQKKEEKSDVKDYLYPAHGITIQAASKEEADAKLVELGKKEINNNEVKN